MYKKMLVPLDASELAEIVFAYAKELSGRLDMEVILLHVYSRDERDVASMRQDYLNKAIELMKHQASEVQVSLGAESGAKPVEVRAVLVEGHPAEEILRYAEENEVDLILMATHGRSGIMRWAMGSVADKVLRASKVPVWLIQASIPKEVVYDECVMETLLVPLDGSEMAESVLPHVEALAKQRGVEGVKVVLLTVCEPPVNPVYDPEGTPLDWPDRMEQCKLEAKGYLDSIAKRLEPAGLNVAVETLAGEVAEGVIESAERNNADLIVMATHGRSGIKRWAYGSVAERVLQAATSPVLQVRQNTE
jgi:nucleotide-binding universal stress UspA family protein